MRCEGVQRGLVEGGWSVREREEVRSRSRVWYANGRDGSDMTGRRKARISQHSHLWPRRR